MKKITYEKSNNGQYQFFVCKKYYSNVFERLYSSSSFNLHCPAHQWHLSTFNMKFQVNTSYTFGFTLDKIVQQENSNDKDVVIHVTHTACTAWLWYCVFYSYVWLQLAHSCNDLKGLLMGVSISILTWESYQYALSREMAQVAWAFHGTCVCTLRSLDGYMM